MRASEKSFIRLLKVIVALAIAFSLFPRQTAYADNLIHIVQPGENLFRIGLKYAVGWPAIMQANGLSNTYIYVGQQLVIPNASAPATTESAVTPATTPTPALPSTTPPTPTQTQTPTPTVDRTYVVQRGDTLFRIATRYGLTVAEMAAANSISDPTLIYAGQVLTIPSGGSVRGDPSAPPPANTGAGKRILIDLSEQHMYVYDGETLVFSFVASSGAPGMNTRPGHYNVQNKIPNAYGGNWNIWMPDWLGIYWAGNLQNGIHALPILPGGGRLWDGYLGTPVSYGCVILGIDDARALYNWADVGTPVDIQY